MANEIRAISKIEKMSRRRRNKGRSIDGIVILDKAKGLTSNAALQAVWAAAAMGTEMSSLKILRQPSRRWVPDSIIAESTSTKDY